MFTKTHHVPRIVGQPINVGLNPTDQMQMFGFWDPFANQKDHKTCRDEWQGEYDGYRHKHIYNTLITGMKR